MAGNAAELKINWTKYDIRPIHLLYMDRFLLFCLQETGRAGTNRVSASGETNDRRCVAESVI